MMGLVAAGLVGFFFFATARLTTPNLSLLFSELSVEDSSRIVARLETQNIPFELRGDGTQIFVPQDQVLRLRMSLVADGVPNGGSVGYEVFDDADRFGTTSFVQQLNQVRALEGELARTISSLSQVQSARVHLVMPRREIFSRDQQSASASVILRLRAAGLATPQVQAIQQLVATAVPGLNPNAISIVDARGTLLARSGDGDGTGLSATNAQEMQQTMEGRLARTIEELLERSVGIGGVRAEVSAEIEFDRLTTNEEIYDPDGQVVRSTQSVESSESNQESSQQDSVSVANNLPQAQEAGEESETRSASAANRTEETVNFEISRTVRTLEREVGTVRRLSVAVLIDGATGPEGEYVARTETEMEQYVALVKSAIGYDEARGDVVEVVNLQFAEPEFTEEAVAEDGLLGFSKQDLFRIAETLVLGVVAILVVLLVVRPIINRILDSIPAADPQAAGGNLLTDQSGGAPQLAAPAGAPGGEVAGGDAQMQLPPGNEASQLDEMIAISSVEGDVRASSMKRVAELVENHPEETVNILRNWMFQET